MKKVYIVTHGMYSEYQIDAVFDKRELAEEYKRLHDIRFVYKNIEEWELNPTYPRLREGWSFYEVRLCGDTTDVEEQESPYDCCDDELKDERYYYKDKVWIFNLYAKSEEHAAKIASEKKAMLIASGEVDKAIANPRLHYSKSVAYQPEEE